MQDDDDDDDDEVVSVWKPRQKSYIFQKEFDISADVGRVADVCPCEKKKGTENRRRYLAETKVFTSMINISKSRHRNVYMAFLAVCDSVTSQYFVCVSELPTNF